MFATKTREVVVVTAVTAMASKVCQGRRTGNISDDEAARAHKTVVYRAMAKHSVKAPFPIKSAAAGPML